MEKGLWFTTIGKSAAAAYNSIWAAYCEKKFLPTKIVIFRLIPRPERKKQVGRLERTYQEFIRWVERFSREVGTTIEIKSIECGEEDYSEYDRAFITALKEQQGIPRAIDITPGRKYASARGMAFGIVEKVEHIFYLHLHDDAFLDLPLPEIPIMAYTLQDFRRK